MPREPVGRRGALAELERQLRGWIALATVLGLAGAALSAVEPLFYKSLLDLLVMVGKTGGHGAAHAAAVRAAWRRGLKIGAGLAGVVALWHVSQSAQGLAVNRIRFRASFELSSRVLARLYAQPLHFHQRTGAGYILTRVDRGVAALGQLASDLLQSLLPNLANLALMMILMARLSPRLAAVALAPMPLFLWATARGARAVAGHEEAVQEGWSRVYGRITEVLSGIKTVKSLAGEERELERYRGQAVAIFRRLWRQVWAELGWSEVKNALAMAGRMGVAVYGFLLVLHGAVTPGTWVAATSYAALLYGPLAGLAGTCSAVARGKVTAAAALEFLAEPDPLLLAADAARLPRLRGAIAFEQVSYAYPTSDGAARRYAIDALSLQIEPGETVAIVGPSGGGKTTLMDLLLRFHDPDEGRILLDGRDLRTVAPAEIRRQMAVVLQEPLLFEGTIADNLAYGCDGVTAERMQAAVRAAQAEEFIARLPEGLGTRLGERGARLSGGEKQRLAIARALLRDPRILILDEATAHLDAASEAALNTALRALVRDRTALVISHRLATLLAADRIIVLAQGRVREQGAPAELARSGGYYARWSACPAPGFELA